MCWHSSNMQIVQSDFEKHPEGNSPCNRAGCLHCYEVLRTKRRSEADLKWTLRCKHGEAKPNVPRDRGYGLRCATTWLWLQALFETHLFAQASGQLRRTQRQGLTGGSQYRAARINTRSLFLWNRDQYNVYIAFIFMNIS